MSNEPNTVMECAKTIEQPLQRFTSNAAIVNFFPRLQREKLTNLSNLTSDKLTNTLSNIK
jgi:hypothetical protein